MNIDDSLDAACRRAQAGASWACNRLEANMTPEAKADLLRAVTDFYEVVRRCLGEAEADQGEREAVFDFVHAVHDASTELIRKLRPNSTQH